MVNAVATVGDVLTLPGCGRYAADSWAIFVEGRLDVSPSDGKLNWYVETKVKKAEKHQTSEGRLTMVAAAKKTKHTPKDAEPAIALVEPTGPKAKLRMTIETADDAEAEVADMPLFEAKTIRDAANRLLVAIHFEAKDKKVDYNIGYSFNGILLRLSQLFPERRPSEACLRWYLMRLRKAEESGFTDYDMPTRFLRPKSKKEFQLQLRKGM